MGAVLRGYWVAAVIAVLVLLLAGGGWLYVRDGDSFLSMTHMPGVKSSTPTTRAHPVQETPNDAVSFSGSTSASELPCSIRRADVQKVLGYLAAKGEKTHADLAEVCKLYGASVYSGGA